jgi:hypothetical protein
MMFENDYLSGRDVEEVIGKPQALLQTARVSDGTGGQQTTSTTDAARGGTESGGEHGGGARAEGHLCMKRGGEMEKMAQQKHEEEKLGKQLKPVEKEITKQICCFETAFQK